jgi:hypothetical protein
MVLLLMVRRRISAVSNHEAGPGLILRDAAARLLRMRGWIWPPSDGELLSHHPGMMAVR